MLPMRDPNRLKEVAREIRLDIVEMLYRAGSGHVGGSLSATDALVALFFGHMHLEPGNACYPDRDFFVLSKGHAAPALYAVLSHLDFSPGRSSSRCANLAATSRATPTPSAPPAWRCPPAPWDRDCPWPTAWLWH